MFTNIYRIGGLHHVSWFQLVPDVELHVPHMSRKEKGRQDAGTMPIMMAHMRLQDEGHLSAWTVSSTKEGSLQRSQSSDDRVKLWIFLPGRQESITSSLHPLITGLKVVGTGVWCAPGDNDEVGDAVTEALRNRLERALRSFSYVRFGDVFVKCRRHGVLESRKVLPTCELMFMGSEDALFVHVIVRRKRVRLLAANDMQWALAHQHNKDHSMESGLTVAVAPYGSSGRLTGCCPGDLVSQLYRSKLQAFTASSLPFRVVSSSSSINGGGAVQSCYAEVWVGQGHSKPVETGLVGSSPGETSTSQGHGDPSLDQAREADGEGQVKSAEDAKGDGKVLIYPMEAVLAPVLPPVPARTYLRRCWLQEWAGTHWLEDSAVPSLNWNRTNTIKEKSQNLVVGANGGQLLNSSSSTSSSSSGSGGSSIKSSSSRGSSSSTSGSSSSSGSEIGTVEGDIYADADSLGSKAINMGSKRNRGKVTGLSGEPSAKVAKRSTSPGGEVPGLLDEEGNAGGRKGSGTLSELNVQGSLNMGSVATPRGAGSQVGTPWDWADEGMGLDMGMEMQTDADILAEFGDFGDFFEDDVLGFGEPPGTAESQSVIFSLGDSGEGVNTPGTISMDGPDPMLLPILDFPTLEGFGQQSILSIKEENIRGARVTQTESLQPKTTGHLSPPTVPAVMSVDPLAKAEALLLFPPGYAPVELPTVEETLPSLSYVPEARKRCGEPTSKEVYVYGATPPVSRLEGSGNTVDQVSDLSHDELGDGVLTDASAEYTGALTGQLVQNLALPVVDSSGDGMVTKEMRYPPHQVVKELGLVNNGTCVQGSSPLEDGLHKCLSSSSNIDIRICASSKSATPALATELECALLQVSMLSSIDDSSGSCSGTRTTSTPPGSVCFKLPSGIPKDNNLELSQNQVDQSGRISSKPPHAQKKKSLPSRIAGDTDEDLQDGPRAAQVGVWRPVQAPKPQKVGNAAADSRIGLCSASPETANVGSDGGVILAGSKLSNWQVMIDAIPLLAQQAAVASDIALDGECGDGPLGWLAFQEQQKHQCACGPGLSHTGCGGMFSIRHCLDDAGVEYIDPLAAEVSPATVANLLQSDFRIAVAAAFGEGNTDGPLTVTDWCRGRVQGDFCGSASGDSKEGMSTITIAVGEPITPPQCNAGNAGVLKISSGQDDLELRRSSNNRTLESLSDQTRGDEQRRSVEEPGTNDSDLQFNNNSNGATMVALPVPGVLVGYQEDWLKTSPNVLRLWEKAPLEPYAPPKPVSYYVLCLGLEPLITAASDFFQQLSSVYEACRLGSHMPAGTSGVTSIAGGSKRTLPGFMIVDCPESVQTSSSSSLMGDFMVNMEGVWNFGDFRKALTRVCKAVPVCSSPINSQRDLEQGQSVVVYVISPSSEPVELLQIMLDASQCLGSSSSEKDKRVTSFNQPGGTGVEESSMAPIVGFSTSRLVLQVLPAETVMKASGTLASELDILKEVAFGVYSKARRIQRKVVLPENAPPPLSSSRVRSGIMLSGSTMPGMWKDCNNVRSSGVNMGLDSGSLRNSWEGGWQSSTSRFGDSTGADGGALAGDGHISQDSTRFLYEPLFILAEPGSPDHGVNNQSMRSGKDATRSSVEEATGSTSGLTPGVSEAGGSAGVEGLDSESTGGGNHPAADLHCCYAWTDDWQWLVSVWTDARGELLDIHVLPLVSAQKDVSLQSFFTQVLHQGLQLLAMAVEAGSQRQRNVIISRLGGFTERECQDWYRTVMMVGGDEPKKWPVQLWPTASGSVSQDIGLLSDRTLGLASSSSRPASPNPPSFTARNKTPGMGMNMPRRPGQGLNSTQSPMESKGLFQWVNSISLVSVRVEHGLQTVCMSDMAPSSGLVQGGSSSATWSAGSVGNSSSNSVTGISTVKTLANVGASYMLVPNNSLRFLSSHAWQLPIVLSLSSPPLALLVQGSPIAPSLASAFVVSPPIPSPMSEFVQQAIKEEWPSTLHVGLIALSGNYSSTPANSKSLKDMSRDSLHEAHRAVQLVAAQVHALSWLTVSPTILLRQSPLPFHCHVAQRLCRLLSYLDVEHGFPRLPHTPV